jgi:hypothetical protein
MTIVSTNLCSLSKDAIQNTSLHFGMLSLFQVVTAPVLFLPVFHGLDTWKVSMICLEEKLSAWVCLMFFLIQLKLCTLGKEITRRCTFLLNHCISYVILINLITADVNLDHAVKVISTRILHCNGFIFPIVLY